MRNSIPNYSETISPLHRLMESCCEKAKNRTKRAVKKIELTGLGGTEHDETFSHVKTQLAQKLKLAHLKENHFTCLFSDESETHWASVLTQVPEDQLEQDFEDQDHKPLSFLSGSFRGSSENWSIAEKEAFAVVESMSRLDYFTAAGEVSLYTDHANLVYIFDPVGHNPGICKHTASKLLRWALKLSGYRYVIEHIEGERNVWADMLTRWAVKPRDRVKVSKLGRLMYAPITPSSQDQYDWPNRRALQESQERSREEPNRDIRFKDGLLRSDAGVVWIPQKDRELKIRLLVAAHTGVGGHRGIRTTTSVMTNHFFWNSIKDDVKEFCRSCLHCMCTATGDTVPRPLGHAIHADKSNAVIHFDYCYISDSKGGPVYILIIKDDLSSYVWLVPCGAADAEHTVDALLKWFSSFGVVLLWVSDQGTHFKNEVVRGLREKTRGSHHFTLAYCPWTNGTVEVVCRELVRVLRALLSEFQLPFTSWPDVVPMVQSALNNTPLERRGGRCPLNVFTGLPTDNPWVCIKAEVEGKMETRSISDIRAKLIIQIEKTAACLE